MMFIMAIAYSGMLHDYMSNMTDVL